MWSCPAQGHVSACHVPPAAPAAREERQVGAAAQSSGAMQRKAKSQESERLGGPHLSKCSGSVCVSREHLPWAVCGPSPT